MPGISAPQLQTREEDSEVPNVVAAPLAELPRGAEARIVDVVASHEDAVRLKSLGLCQGRTVQLVADGDPLIVRVQGTRVGLSRRLAHVVRVEVAR